MWVFGLLCASLLRQESIASSTAKNGPCALSIWYQCYLVFGVLHSYAGCQSYIRTCYTICKIISSLEGWGMVSLFQVEIALLITSSSPRYCTVMSALKAAVSGWMRGAQAAYRLCHQRCLQPTLQGWLAYDDFIVKLRKNVEKKTKSGTQSFPSHSLIKAFLIFDL